MNLFEKITYGFGKMKGQYHKGLENVFSTSGARPRDSDESIWLDDRAWGEGLLEDKRPRTKQQFVNAFREWVYISVRLNANSVAATPLRLYVAKGTAGQKFSTVTTKAIDKPCLKWLQSNSSLEKWTSKAVEIEEITDHAFLDLEREVNPWNNRRDLYESTSMFLDLTGESYWLLIMNGAGVPDQIWNIPAQYVTPIFGKTLEEAIVAFNYKRGSIDVDIPAENIVFFKYPNPHNMFTGFSTVRGIADAVYLSYQMNEFEAGLFENRARPGGVFTAKGNVSKEERDRLEGKLTQKFSGAKKAGKNLMLSGDLSFTRDTMTPEELSYIEGRRINRTEILAAYDIPEAVIISESSNRAVAEAADYRHAKNGILPRLKRIEEKINEKLMPLYDPKLFVAFDNPVPEDVAFLLEKQIKQVNSNIIVRNEVREAEGLEPTPWGEFAWFDNRLIPVGEDFIPPEVPEETETPEVAPEEIEEEEKVIIKQALNKNAELFKALFRSLFPYEREYKMMLANVWEKERKIIVTNLQKIKKAWLSKDVIDNILYPKGEFEKELSENALKIDASIIDEQGKTIMNELASVDAIFDVTNPEVQNWLNSYTPKFSKELEKVSITKLRRELTEGIAAGESIPELMRRVNGTYANWNRVRSGTIARTETLRASNQGTLESYKQSGVVRAKVWVTHLDDRTCVSCIKLNNKVISIEKNFFNQGDPPEVIISDGKRSTFSNDYEDISAPPRHALCRCTIAASFYDPKTGLSEPQDLFGDIKTNPTKYKKEHGAWFDKQGRIVLNKKGTATHIPITDANHVKLATQDIGTMIHTHPHHLAFSGGDLAHAAGWEIGEMQVLTHKGLYKIKPKIGRGGNWGFNPETIASEFKSIMNSLKGKYNRRYTQLFGGGSTFAEARAISAAEHIHEVNAILAKKYQLAFSFE